MRLKIVCEGRTEKGLRKLIQRIINDRFPDRESRRKISIGYDFMEGVPEVLKELDALSEKSINDGCERVLCLIDLHNIHEHFPEALNRALSGKNFLRMEISERVDWLKRNITAHLLPGHLRNRVRIHIALHETEAWFLADPDTLSMALGKKMTCKYPDPEAVDDEKPPHRRLRERYSYKKSSHGRKCLEELDYELVARKCPQFRAFLDDVLSFAEQAVIAP